MKRILTALLLTAVCAVPAFADMHGNEGKEHRKCECREQMGKERMHKRGDILGMLIMQADKVGLTDDQVAKLKVIHRGMEKKKIRFVADLKLAKIDLKEVMEVKDFDLDKASAAAQKISDIKRDQRLEMLKSIKDVRSILTDEQFKKINHMRHHMRLGNKPEGKKPEGKKPEGKKEKEHHQE